MLRHLAGLLLLCSAAWAVCTSPCYIDVNATTAGTQGTQADPFHTLAAAWSTINTNLASGAVTVYFSACNAACSASDTTSAQMDLSQRTDTSTNILTLDGEQFYNPNSPAGGTWNANIGYVTCTGYRCAATATAMTSHKMQITGTSPLTGPTGSSDFSNCKGYFIVQGFEFANTDGQSADATYLSNLTLQYNEFHRTATGTLGPGVIVGPAQHGPCHTGAARPNGTDSGPDNVTIQYNYIHETWGECIYIGASTPDPFSAVTCPSCQQAEAGTGGTNLQCGNGCNSNATTCTTPGTPATCPTGANYLVQYNTIESCAAWGGQGDGTDVKDGHTNLQIIGNTYRTSLFPACAGSCTNLICYNGTNNGTSCTSNANCTGGGVCGAGNDGQGPLFESGSLVSGNYIEAPGHSGSPVYSSWNNSTGRGDIKFENNIIINVNSGLGTNDGIILNAPNNAGDAIWTTAEIYNNTIYLVGQQAGGDCISVQSGYATGASTVQNNLCISTVGFITGGVATHDYNDFFPGSNSETHGIAANPNFVSTTAPYNDVKFKLQGGSPAIGVGLNLSGTFTKDFFGTLRPGSNPWTMGFFEPATGSSFFGSQLDGGQWTGVQIK